MRYNDRETNSKMDKATAKKYLKALQTCPIKYVTSETLAHELGIYPDVINAELSYFDPLLKLDLNYDLRELLPALEAYLAVEAPARPVKKSSSRKRKTPVRRKKAASDLPYASLVDFIYARMTFDGFLNRSFTLRDEDLKLIRKLVALEQQRLRKKKDPKAK